MCWEISLNTHNKIAATAISCYKFALDTLSRNHSLDESDDFSTVSTPRHVVNGLELLEPTITTGSRISLRQ